MSLFLPLRRATLLVPSGPENDPDRKHLFILLTDPADAEAGVKAVLMVSLSSIKAGLPHDPACLLYPGDHPFVKRNSFVVYQKARIEEAEKVLRGVKDGKLVATVFQDARGQGAGAIEVAAKLAKGESVPKTTFIPFQLVTKENLDKFMPK